MAATRFFLRALSLCENRFAGPHARSRRACRTGLPYQAVLFATRPALVTALPQ